MKTIPQIESQVKREVKKLTKKQNVISLVIVSEQNEFYTNGSVKVIMDSTCKLNGTMTWNFYYDYEPSNKNDMTEIERLRFPEMITKEKLTINQF